MVDPVSDDSARGTHLKAEAEEGGRSSLLACVRRVQARLHHPRKAILLVAVVLVGTAWALSSSGGATTAQASSSQSSAAAAPKVDAAKAGTRTTTTSVVPPVATTTSTTVPVKAPPAAVPAVAPAVPVVAPVTAPAVAAVPAPVVPAATEPSVAALVSEVEAAGIDPGSNWSWSMGDTATHCSAMTGAGTGCTYGSNGLEYTVFSGSPTLALVAHELANAETENDAVPSLLNEVAVAAAGSSWSPTDAVASCLVVNFMGFQDDSAGTWQCPAALGTIAAANIHDSI
jgi:hypothetical protein